jgi:hypothetical protein
MAFSLYAATIPSYQQILGSVAGLLVKAQAFCAEKSINHDDIIQARLAPDMLPFAYAGAFRGSSLRANRMSSGLASRFAFCKCVR